MIIFDREIKAERWPWQKGYIETSLQVPADSGHLGLNTAIGHPVSRDRMQILGG